MSWEIVVAVVVVCIIGGWLLHFYRMVKNKEFLAGVRASSQTLEIIVPRLNESHIKDIEDFFQTVTSFYQKRSLFQRLQGFGQYPVHLEIVAEKGSIRFYMRIPKGTMQNSLVNVLHGKYPSIQILPVEDTMKMFMRRDLVVAVGNYSSPDMFSLKGYRDIERTKEGMFTDPLSPLVSAYSTLQEGEVAYYGVHITPLGSWGKTLLKRMARLWSQGAFSFLGKGRLAFVQGFVRKSWLWRVLWFPFLLSPTPIDSKEDAAHKDMVPKQEMSLLEVHVDLAYAGKRPEMIDELSASFATLSAPGGNGLEFSKKAQEHLRPGLLKRRGLGRPMIMTTEEVSMLWHPPTSKLESPYIAYQESALEMFQEEHDEKSEGNEHSSHYIIPNATVIGTMEHYGKSQPFSIDDIDRRRHVYIIGQTGTGKSTLQEQMILSNIYKGNGVAVVDPHGEMVEKILKYIPSFRKNDVAYFDPSDVDNPPAFNILNVDEKGKDLMATELLGVFHKMFENSWGPRMEQILYNTLAALVETPDATLVDIPAFITTKTFREQCLRHCSDEHVIGFWHDQFDVLDPKTQNESVVAVLNKVEKFLNNKIIRGVFASKRNRFNFDFIMNKQKILLVNLSKGKISPKNSEIIGSMIVSRLLIDAMKRIQIPEEERKDFYLYIDEFQNFVSSVHTFESILSEARKYRLNLTIAHQYMKQLPEELRSAIFGNVGTIMSFRVGLEDAEVLVKQFGEDNVTREQLTTLVPYTLYSRSIKNNKITAPVKVKTLSPISGRYEQLPPESVDSLLEFSKKQYSWNTKDKETLVRKEKMVRTAKEREVERRNKKKKR